MGSSFALRRACPERSRRDLARSGYAPSCHVAVRARSFRTEVLQDDPASGEFSKLSHTRNLCKVCQSGKLCETERHPIGGGLVEQEANSSRRPFHRFQRTIFGREKES